jgi:hypothetical protein
MGSGVHCVDKCRPGWYVRCDRSQVLSSRQKQIWSMGVLTILRKPSGESNTSKFSFRQLLLIAFVSINILELHKFWSKLSQVTLQVH